MDFKTKTAIVTGGNSGIGAAIAAALAKAGTRLIIAGRTQDRNGAVAETLKEQFGTGSKKGVGASRYPCEQCRYRLAQLIHR